MDVTVEAPPRVPGFELGVLLGRGSSAEVWEAVRCDDGRRVALKVVPAGVEEAEAAAREAAVSARVAAEHVLAVESCVPLDGGGTALVMPVLRGGSLARLVAARGHLSPGEVVTVLAPLAAALGRLHAAGVVHGDVSPGNVLLDLDGRPVLADLGLGRVRGEAPTAVWGTEGHLAPEVLMGSDPSPASDVYALGALAWLGLSGQVPGAPGLRPGLAEVNRAGDGSGELVAVVESAVAPRPGDRPSADELGWLLFGAAEAEPLHLVAGEDEVSSVTYRLRAAAGRRPEPGPTASERRFRWRVPRPSLPRPSRPRLRRPPGRHQQARPSAAPPGRAGRGVLRAAVGRHRRRAALVAVALATTLGGLSVGAVAWAANRDDGVGGRPVVPAAAPSGGPVTRPPPPAAAPTAVTAADPRLDAAAPAERPAALLEVLAEARAAAWRTGGPERLAGAEVPGSPLHERDVAALEQLAAAGLRYSGLHYVLSSVEPVSADASRAVLRATIGTGAHEVTGAGSSAARAAQEGQELLVDLERTPQGWRVSDLRPSGPRS